MHPLRLFEYCPRCGSHRFQENDASSKRCEDCGFVYYLNPKASVAAFVMDRQSRILVCRRAFDPSKGMLDLPGGVYRMRRNGRGGCRSGIVGGDRLETEADEVFVFFPECLSLFGFRRTHDGFVFSLPKR